MVTLQDASIPIAQRLLSILRGESLIDKYSRFVIRFYAVRSMVLHARSTGQGTASVLINFGETQCQLSTTLLCGCVTCTALVIVLTFRYFDHNRFN